MDDCKPIDSRDELRPVREVIEARTGKKLSDSTLWRWREVGVNGVRLKCVPAGKTWLTTAAMFAAFVQGQAEAREELAARAG